MHKSPSLKIAHISDIHYGKITLSPLQFFSKRWIGNANLLLSRKNAFKPREIENIAEDFKKRSIEGVIITGDFTCTSLKDEFEMAKEFIEALEKEGFWVIAIPGNHDHYTKNAYKNKIFYHYISASKKLMKENLSLKEEGIEIFKIEDFWVVALDTTLATPLLSASGFFSEKIEKHLRAFLLQRNDADKVLIANHFPFFNTGNPRNFLKRGEVLEDILKNNPCVKLYLHGHNHRNTIADLRSAELPILLDSGSLSLSSHGSWNLLDLYKDKCVITPILKDKKEKLWKDGKSQEFIW